MRVPIVVVVDAESLRILEEMSGKAEAEGSQFTPEIEAKGWTWLAVIAGAALAEALGVKESD
jgi:hypothetical protein